LSSSRKSPRSKKMWSQMAVGSLEIPLRVWWQLLEL